MLACERVRSGHKCLGAGSGRDKDERERERETPPALTQLSSWPGIIYCNGGLAAAESVADFAVAMVISTFRQLPWVTSAALVPHLQTLPSSPSPSSSSSAAEAAFRFSHTHTTAHARNPRNHVLGIIGLGKIGHLLARKLGNPSFGMHIHYHDVARKPAGDEASAYVSAFHATLPSLLAASDAVVLCTPARPDGAPLMTRAALSHLRRGARFVNIARGSLVDEEALADALEAGVVGSAALDVHADEPRVHGRLLALAGTALARAGPDGGEVDARTGVGKNPARVMLTCHNAGGTVDTHIGFEELAMRNILAVLGGQEPITPVNLHFLNTKTSRL